MNSYLKKLTLLVHYFDWWEAVKTGFIQAWKEAYFLCTKVMLVMLQGSKPKWCGTKQEAYRSKGIYNVIKENSLVIFLIIYFKCVLRNYEHFCKTEILSKLLKDVPLKHVGGITRKLPSPSFRIYVVWHQIYQITINSFRVSSNHKSF